MSSGSRIWDQCFSTITDHDLRNFFRKHLHPQPYQIFIRPGMRWQRIWRDEMAKDMNLIPHRHDSDTIYLHMHVLKHQITFIGTLNYTKFWPTDLFYIVILPQVNDFLGTQGLKDLISINLQNTVCGHLSLQDIWTRCTWHNRKKKELSITPIFIFVHFSKLDCLGLLYCFSKYLKDMKKCK